MWGSRRWEANTMTTPGMKQLNLCMWKLPKSRQKSLSRYQLWKRKVTWKVISLQIESSNFARDDMIFSKRSNAKLYRPVLNQSFFFSPSKLIPTPIFTWWKARIQNFFEKIFSFPPESHWKEFGGKKLQVQGWLFSSTASQPSGTRPLIVKPFFGTQLYPTSASRKFPWTNSRWSNESNIQNPQLSTHLWQMKLQESADITPWASPCCPLEQIGQVHRSPAQPWPLSQPNGSRYFLHETKLSSIKNLLASNLFIWIVHTDVNHLEIPWLIYQAFFTANPFDVFWLCSISKGRSLRITRLQAKHKQIQNCVRSAIQCSAMSCSSVMYGMVWYEMVWYECNVSESYSIIHSPKSNMESKVKSISWDLLAKKTVTFGV